MKKAVGLLFLASLTALLAIGVSGCKHTGPEASSNTALQIGAAESEITPPIGHRMAGYFDERLATGVHDPLKAKAIILEQEKERIAMVFCDLVGVSLTIT